MTPSPRPEVEFLNADLEEKVRQLSSANRQLEQFAWAVSHDLKEPLRTVSAYTQLLLRRFGSGDPEETELAGYIRQGVERMKALIDGVLEYALAADRAPGTADAVEAASIAIDSLRNSIERSGGRVHVSDLPPVGANPAALVQVFSNLIDNALKFRREGVPPEVHIAAERQGHMVQFAVSDNGIGIQPEHRDRIFALFGRLHGEEYEGIGLGLALIRRMVEAVGGTIWVDSTPGKGSTFYFTLPGVKSKGTN